ncbi:sigma-54-dependent transcriptional regulator [Mariluticola halotolerans]|uniref:sigma-54-dependent transcriptional regulator n=1 Tax=Mariluticola halotolerans TaxID=2909283 RepID=UPI0026E244E8|nr:sigma-54 dependent transcriptional regulator [Mariluticola halotolerans]UJQ94546.1 sigma-54 dependent transcriptional regulator [Mariluticola halotolerans]
MSTSVEILFVDDEEHLRIAASQTLDLAGYKVRTMATAAEALSTLSRTYNGILVSDIRMPGMDGMQLLRAACAIDADLPVVLVTGHGDINLAVEAMREGAYDFIEKPFTTERFLESISRAAEKRALTLENRALRDSITNRPDDLEVRLAGRSQMMAAIRNQIRTIASTPSDVLIIGDTGTGKEVAARAIHDLSEARDHPFVVIDCAALPAEMIEAELFGYEAGAFAGAIRPRFGKLEHGRNGTIFLDHAHTMPPELQARLLRVIEDRSITRLGSHDPIKLNCRFIGASNLELEADNHSDADTIPSFSRDLLYRLNVVTLRLPPLKAHTEDIPQLFIQMVDAAATRFRRDPPPPPDALITSILNREWPGNVRELHNAAERYVLGINDGNAPPPNSGTQSLKDRVAAFESEAIAAELRARNGNLKAAYESLGLSRKTLYEKMQKYDLSRTDFKKRK